MKLVLEILEHAGDEQVFHRLVEKFPARIGRGFDNDIILSDPHVSAHHLRIDCIDASFSVSDLDSDNGLSINAAARSGCRADKLRSGDVLRIGQTEIRVYTPDHPVPAAVKLQRPHPFFSWLSVSKNVWAVLLLSMAVMLNWSFLEIWADEPRRFLSMVAAIAAGIVIVWAAVWSVTGRLAKQKARFRSHAALLGIYMIASICAWYIATYLDFLTNESRVSSLVSHFIQFVLLGFLIYGSLSLATRMTQTRRRKAAAASSLFLIGGMYMITLIDSEGYSPDPLYSATLEPYFSHVPAADTPDAFIVASEKIFSSDEFAAKENAAP